MSDVPVSISEGNKGYFDFIFYANNNADVATVVGADDRDSLWKHFVNFGRFENRIHRFILGITISGSGNETNGNILVFNSSISAWEPSSSVVARSLATTGDTVNISSANAPSIDQVLTATSATTATWQTPTSFYGKEFRSATGGPTAVTNATNTFEEALSISNAITPAGTYKVSWMAESSTDSLASQDTELRISMTGNSTDIIGFERYRQSDLDNSYMLSGYGFITLTNASHGVIMEFRLTLGAGPIHSIGRRSLEIIRIS